MIQTNNSAQSGFALLITLLTVGVIISATLAIVELSRLQLRLSVDSRDAEMAFSAANAAKECAQYIRNAHSDGIRAGQNRINTNCLEQSVRVDRVTSLEFGTPSSVGSNGNDVYRYRSLINWDASGANRCSVIEVIVVYANTGNITIGGSGTNSLQRVISNYRGTSMTCVRGSECTIIAASGYNSTCSNRNAVGVLKREVLLEF
ncbi:MAG: hypothetical protein ACK42D_02510 [Candidatus Paceibacteria bacterium]